MSEATDRPQDRGRSHRRTRTAPAPSTAPILEAYRAAMRDELGDTLRELRPGLEQLTIAGGAERVRPALAERVKLWDLAIKLGRELAAGEDLEPEPAAGDGPAAARAPRLTPAQRRALGG